MILRPRTIVYAAKAVLRKLWRLATRQNMVVDQAEQVKRLAICNRCDLNQNGYCAICTCNCKMKVMWADEYCPANPPKWS